MDIAKRFLVPLIGAVLALAATAGTTREVASRSFDLRRSHLTVYVYKQGLFAFAADNHEIDAPIVAGSYDETRHAVDVTIDATKMLVLDPKLTADRRASVQANMTSAKVLDVERFPTITFHSTAFTLDSQGHGAVTGDLTLHGQTHSIVVDVSRVDSSHFEGSSTVRQTAFGITPIRIVGGAVTVKNDVKVVFDVYFAGS